MTDRRRPWEAWLCWAGLVGLALSIGIHRIRSYDYWWHLRTGQWIFENGSVPKADPFSYTALGSQWIDIHWLFQLALHGVHSFGGHAGVVVAKAAAILLILGLCGSIGRRTGREAVSCLALAMMLLVAADRFMPRPEMSSFVFLVSQLFLLDREERRDAPGDAWLFAVVPIQLLWVNSHGLFALGIALCGLYFAGEMLRPLLHRGTPLRTGRARRFGLLALVVAALSILNPNGIDGALYPIQQLGMIGTPETRAALGSMILELTPPISATHVAQPLATGIAGALALLCLCAMGLNRRKLPPAHVLIFIAFGILGLLALRNLALFALVAAPIAVRNTNELFDRHPRFEPWLRRARVALAVGLCLAAWDVAAGRYFQRLGSHREPGLGLQAASFPIEAVDWIRRERPPGPICHGMVDGGYLIAALHPDYPVMLDGRLEVYGGDRFERLSFRDIDRINRLDAEYQFGSILVHHSLRPVEELLWSLHVHAKWRLVFVDEVAALFVRVAEDGSPQWPEVELNDPKLFPEREWSEATDLAMRMARTNFHRSTRQFDRALAQWDALLAHHPDFPDGASSRASLNDRVTATATERSRLAALLATRPDEPRLLLRLADLELENGRLEAARDLYDRALESAPEDVSALIRRAELAESEADLDLASRLYARIVASRVASESAIQSAREHLDALEARKEAQPPGP